MPVRQMHAIYRGIAAFAYNRPQRSSAVSYGICRRNKVEIGTQLRTAGWGVPQLRAIFTGSSRPAGYGLRRDRPKRTAQTRSPERSLVIGRCKFRESTGWFNTCTDLANGSQVNCQPGQSPAWQISSRHFLETLAKHSAGPGLLEFDTGVSRQFRVTERLSVQFAEIFNIMNRAEFLPCRLRRFLSSSSYGQHHTSSRSGPLRSQAADSNSR